MDSALFDLLARWAHFLAGVIWIGHNYSSVVQRPSWRPLLASDLADASSPRLQAVINREHGTFRYASVVAWSAGMYMLWQRGWLPDALMLKGSWRRLAWGPGSAP
jgi:uncharacterized membrane protein